jgi:hypothetical protein
MGQGKRLRNCGGCHCQFGSRATANSGLEFTWLHISWNGEETKLTKMILEFISRECKRGLHEEARFRGEGLGFEIICACSCSHRPKATVSTDFVKTLQISESVIDRPTDGNGRS